MKKVILLLLIVFFNSIAYGANIHIDTENIKWILELFNKNELTSGLNLNNNTVLSSPLSKAEATLFLYVFLLTKQKNITFPFSGNIDFYPKYVDLDKNTLFYKPATLLQTLKGYDNITVLPFSYDHPVFNPLHHVSKYEFVKMLIELINAKKEGNYSLLKQFSDYNKLTKEQQIYFSTALKLGIKFSDGYKINPDKKLTVYDALEMLNSLKDYKILSYKKSDFKNVMLFIFVRPYSNKVGVIPEVQDYDPTITGIKITGVEKKLSGNCMKLVAHSEASSKANKYYVWESDFGYLKSLDKNNSKVIFCPPTKESIYDYHLSVTANDGFMNFDKYDFFIKKSKFKYVKNIGDEKTDSIKFNISLKLKDKKLKEYNIFCIFKTGGLFKNNLRIGLEGVNIILKSNNKKKYINNAYRSNNKICFLVDDIKGIDLNNVSLDVIYATNYKFGHQVFNLTAKPQYVINGILEPNERGEYPKYVFINGKKVEVFDDGSFIYMPKNAGKYVIKVNDKHYEEMTINLTDRSPKVNVYISYMDLDYDKDGVDNDEDAFPYNPAFSLDSDGDGYPDKYNTGYDSANLPIDKFPHDKYRYKSKYDAVRGTFYGYLTYGKCFDLKQTGGRTIDLINHKEDYCFFLNDYRTKQVFYLVDDPDTDRLSSEILKQYVNNSIYLSGLAVSTDNLIDGVFPRCENCRIYKLLKIDTIKLDLLGTKFYPPKFKSLISYKDYVGLKDRIKKYLKKKLMIYKSKDLKDKYLLKIYSKLHKALAKVQNGDTSKGLNLQLYYILSSIASGVSDLLYK